MNPWFDGGDKTEPPKEKTAFRVKRSYRKILRNRKQRIARRLDAGRCWSDQPEPIMTADSVLVALIVEDDQTLLDLLEERLLSMGHQCRKARSQAEADAMLAAHPFDYILLDLEIPRHPEGTANIVYGQNHLGASKIDLISVKITELRGWWETDGFQRIKLEHDATGHRTDWWREHLCLIEQVR